MALIKKTVVLTNNGAEGYITVVRVGDEVGAKIVGAAFQKGMLAALKIGINPVVYTKLDGEKTEIYMNVSFNQNDDISCLIMQEDVLIAKAGKLLNKRDLRDNFAKKEDIEESNIEIIEKVEEIKPVTENQSHVEEMQKTNNLSYEEEMQKTNSTMPTREKLKPKTSKSNAKATENRVSDVIDNLKADALEPNVGNNPFGATMDNVNEKDFLSKLHSTGSKNFYQNVKERLEDLFVIHPREKELENIIPESKWVKIRYDGDDYYVVGSLTDDGTVAYLAYGVPGVKDIPPPKLATDISDWLPVPNLPAPYEGYWLIFQNAEDGKVGNIK